MYVGANESQIAEEERKAHIHSPQDDLTLDDDIAIEYACVAKSGLFGELSLWATSISTCMYATLWAVGIDSNMKT